MAADALLRVDIAALDLLDIKDVDFATLARDQHEDTSCQVDTPGTYLGLNETLLPLTNIYFLWDFST